MLYSMTGFGRAVVATASKKIIVEVKSLNSKQMDLTVRIPSVLRAGEADVRNIVAQELQRGKADVNILCETIGADTASTLNVAAMQSYKRQIEEASAAMSLPLPDDWYSLLLRLPDVLHAEVAADASEEEMQALLQATAMACEEAMAHRRAEGQKLEEFFAQRIKHIGDYLAQVAPYEHERVAKIRARIEENLQHLPNAEYDKSRFEQEMIFYIEKLDINEEKQRLAQHLAYFMETMVAPEGGQGKKLGFISQEMGREINTLGSKSNHAEMQKLVVKMKDELEQIKEQVLNVM